MILNGSVKEEAKKEKVNLQRQRVESFFKCKDKCVCKESPCCASRLKQCTNCQNILLSKSTKSSCKGLGTMIKPACDQKMFPILLDSESEGSDEDILFERQVVL